jgi:hypothetical protein
MFGNVQYMEIAEATSARIQMMRLYNNDLRKLGSFCDLFFAFSFFPFYTKNTHKDKSKKLYEI